MIKRYFIFYKQRRNLVWDKLTPARNLPQGKPQTLRSLSLSLSLSLVTEEDYFSHLLFIRYCDLNDRS